MATQLPYGVVSCNNYSKELFQGSYVNKDFWNVRTSLKLYKLENRAKFRENISKQLVVKYREINFLSDTRLFCNLHHLT